MSGRKRGREKREEEEVERKRKKKKYLFYLCRRLRPGEPEGRLLPARGPDRERLPVLGDRRAPELADGRVELQQVGRGLGHGQRVVDGDDVEAGEVDAAEAERPAEREPADSAEAVDEGAGAPGCFCHIVPIGKVETFLVFCVVLVRWLGGIVARGLQCC